MKRRNVILIILLILLIVFPVYFWTQVTVSPPLIPESELTDPNGEVEKKSDYVIYGNNWLRKNEYGLWELYLEGSAYPRGLAFGKLTESLLAEKEQAFCLTR